MVGSAGSPVWIVNADVTLTRSKVKVRVSRSRDDDHQPPSGAIFCYAFWATNGTETVQVALLRTLDS